MADFPALQGEFFDFELANKLPDRAPPRILILYGSLRERSFSRFAAEEAGRLLTAMGASVQTFNPSGLPLPDDAPESHPKVVELRERVRWCDGMIWSSPERHGAMSAVMKAQIDWIPLSEGAVRPFSGQNAGGDAGVRRFPVIQRRQSDADPRALDADVYYPESIVCPQGLAGI